MPARSVREKAKKVKLLLLDVDGVLTDGKIVFDSSGRQLKFFDVQDGLGVILLKRAGINTVLITARRSNVVTKRAKDIQVFKTYQDARDKRKAYEDIKKTMRLSDKEICFIGDELIDLPVLKRVGFAVAVPNACPEAKRQSDYITKKSGGSGAAREVIEIILKSQNKWKKTVAVYQ